MKKIQIYTQINNELIVNSLRDCDYLDAVTPAIPADCVVADVELPPISKNQAYYVSGEKTNGRYTVSNNVVVVADYRGAEVYDKETGEKVEITELGELPENLTETPRPSKYHTFTHDTWVLTDKAKKQQLADKKDEKLTTLNAAAEKTVEMYANPNKVPEFERATWEIQRQEAVAWHADNTTPTPNLDRIAKNRGVPAEILRERTYKKTMLYQNLTMTIAGQRQHFEDLIFAAKTLEELEQVECKFKVTI